MFSVKQVQCTIYLLNFLWVRSKCGLPKDMPDLSVLNYYQIWKEISNETIYEYPAYYTDALASSGLKLDCFAPYPVHLVFTGHFSPTNYVKFEPPNRLVTNAPTYHVSAEVLTTQWDESDWGVSARVSCQKIGQPEVEKSVLVFVQRNSTEILVGPKEQNILDSKLIPCPTKNPTVMPRLYKITDETQETLVNNPHIKYNFYQGFQSNITFNGIYICRLDNSSLMINATDSSATENFEIIPKDKLIRVFAEDTIQFSCRSKLRKPVNLILGDADKNLSVVYSSNGESATVKMLTMFPPSYSRGDISRLEAKGKCIMEDGDNETVLMEWSYEFIKTPELHINNFKRSIDCLTNIKPSSVHVFRCANKMECNFFSKFLSATVEYKNPYDTQRHFTSTQSGYCSGERFARYCVVLPYPHSSGLAQCNVDGLVRQWEFFTSLDHRKYTNWKEAPKKELIRMVEEKFINGVTQFYCSAVSYLFADSIYFEIEFRNGTRQILQNNDVTVNISDKYRREHREIEGLTFVGILDIILPQDTAVMYCIAGFWNETNELRTSQKYELTKETSNLYTILGATSVFVICGLIFMLVIYMKRYKTAQQALRNLTDEEVDQFFKGRPELIANAGLENVETVDLLPFPEEYKIPLDDLAFDSGANFLGFGNFSYVVRGTVISKGLSVAIKISKPSANVDFFKSLLSEVKIMVYIGKHENVVNLTGVCTESIRNRSIHIATEVCELGDLKNFLMKARPSFQNIINANKEIDISLISAASPTIGPQLTILDLIRFSCEIAKGMEYLSYKMIIHADLATRNVLLTSDKVIKVSDFGLSKKLYENTNYVKKSSTPLPWRWMAIESLTTLTFSTNSDIWAYGVTLFEIFSLGDTPYPNEEWNSAFLARLEDGMRMGRPKHSTKEIYHLMSECWEKEPELRPSFSTLRSFFEKLSGRYFVPSKPCNENNDLWVPEENNVSEATTPPDPGKLLGISKMEHEPCTEPDDDVVQPEYTELHEYSTIKHY